MKTLIIYDNTGFIIMTQMGEYRIPKGGINYLEVEVPEGKRAVNIDTETMIPLYEDLPKSETEALKNEVDALKQDLADLLIEITTGGIQ